MSQQTQAETTKNISGDSIHNDNPYTFPILHIGAKNKVTVVANTMKDYSVEECGECGKYFVALKDHPKDMYGNNICIYCQTVNMNDSVIDTCDHGHKFAALSDHPIRDNQKHCVHCLAQGFDNLQEDSAPKEIISTINRAIAILKKDGDDA